MMDMITGEHHNVCPPPPIAVVFIDLSSGLVKVGTFRPFYSVPAGLMAIVLTFLPNKTTTSIID